MPRVLIAGFGYVGIATAKVFLDAGWEVEGWTSSRASAETFKETPFVVKAVDITDSSAVRASASAADGVIQCVSSGGGTADAYRQIYLAGAQNLAAAFPATPLLFTSSTSVYGQTSGEWVTEESAAVPPRETGAVLRETEKFVLARGGTVVRLAGIYGPGRCALLRKFMAGTAVLDGLGDRFINQAHRDDIASALFHLLQPDCAAARGGEIFNVADGEPLTERECYAWLSQHLNRPMPLPASGAIVRKRGNSNKRVSSRKLQSLGWTPRFCDFRMGMEASVLAELDRAGA
ncbi:MAG: NAD-dependent epimerase/dehydratase family protein [Verrucomicrobiota bacterium]|nr:NAD-dependent epimerase/dehydratase family protein [Verrucomicrobiota bacterium]